MDGFQDIMPMAEIPIDYAYYLMLFLAVIILPAILVVLIRIVLKKRRPVSRPTVEEVARNGLRQIDFHSTDSKALLYTFTLHAKRCVTPENEQRLQGLLLKLEPYKYTQEQQEIEAGLIEEMKGYVTDAIR